MFVIPFLPNWIFEGPRTVRHWPQRHVCGECGASWTGGHVCEAGGSEPVLPARSERLAERETALLTRARPERERLVGELRRLDR